MNKSFFLYLLAMAGTTYLIRMLPLMLCKKKITNVFLLSFLYYVPYAVLTVMTIPGCFYATGHIGSAVVGFLVGFVLAWRKQGLMVVAAGAAAGVFIGECFIAYVLPLL